MTSLTKGASPRVPASLPFAPARNAGHPADIGRPDLRWRHGRGLLSQTLLSGFFLLAKPLIALQQRLEERDKFRRMPDYLLKDIGLDRNDLGLLDDDLIKHR